jgi:hypothetical protein
MVAITALNAATPPAQVWQNRSQLAQARQDADRAEVKARQLRAQADQAEQASQRDQAKVSALSAQLQRSDSTYRAPARQQAAPIGTPHPQGPPASQAPASGGHFSFQDGAQASASAFWAAANRKSSSGRLVNVAA